MLDNRLKMCAEMVSGKGVVCDVGTDHALLAAELITSGKCEKVIASDIKEGPLESARKTVEKYGISDKVKLVLSDGLDRIYPEGVTDIVIAGMGGEMIVEIIRKCTFSMEDIRFILQPMTKPEFLRKWLSENCFEITSERAVEDGDKFYTVIAAKVNFEYKRAFTEFEALAGKFDFKDEIEKKFRMRIADRLDKISESLHSAGKENDSIHYAAMSQRMREGVKMTKISDIYAFLNEKFPFSFQEKWDNSGMLVESNNLYCNKILLTLDITNSAVDEAERKEAELVISHHPVIFDPLKKISWNSPVYRLIRNDISAICMHTNLDIAEGGTNTAIVKKIAEKLEISESIEPLEECGFGCIIELKERVDADRFSDVLKEIFGLDRIKMSMNGEYVLSKIAICSGSGGSLWRLAKEKGCDALITGDVKHDVWIDANNGYFTIFDCGHFQTENLVLEEIRRALEEEFPCLDVEIADSSVAPCCYV